MAKVIQKIEGYKLVNAGMFNVAKGIAIAIVILEHALDLKLGSADLGFTSRVIHNMVIPLFFIVSGYSFAPCKMKKGIARQAKMLLKPYLYTAVGVLVLSFVAWLIFCPPALRSFVRVGQDLVGYILGLSFDLEIGGHYYALGVGTVWYLLALFLTWVLMNFLVQKFGSKPKVFWTSILACMILGTVAGCFIKLPWCIIQSLCCIGCYAFGWWLKKKNVFAKPVPWKILLACFALNLLGGFLGRLNMASTTWTLGIIDIFLASTGAFFVIAVTVRASAYDWPLKSGISWLGRNSLVLICLECLFNHGLPWQEIFELLNLDTVGAIIFSYIAMISLISVSVFIISKLPKKKKSKNKAGKKETK